MPFGDEDVSVRCDEARRSAGKKPGAAAPPRVPSVIRSLPSGLNSKTWFPFVAPGGGPKSVLAAMPCARGASSWPSVTHTLPSRSTKMPCGKISSPAPKLFTSFPDASNFRIEGRLEPAQEFVPQRSATQMLRPSLSISTALVDPHSRPSGSLK